MSNNELVAELKSHREIGSRMADASVSANTESKISNAEIKEMIRELKTMIA